MSDLVQLGFAFSAGIAAAFNPCGVAMLPSYISYILGREEKESYRAGAFRGLAAGGAMTGGFFTIFGLFGVQLFYLGQVITMAIPWIVILIGAGLIVLGILMFFGRMPVHLNVGNVTSILENRAGKEGYRAFYFFGIAYGLASLSCTLPVFLIIVSQSFASKDLLSGIMAFVFYSSGMGLVVMAISVATFLSRQLITRYLNQVARYIERAASLVIIAAGAYLIYFWLSKGT